MPDWTSPDLTGIIVTTWCGRDGCRQAEPCDSCAGMLADATLAAARTIGARHGETGTGPYGDDVAPELFRVLGVTGPVTDDNREFRESLITAYTVARDTHPDHGRVRTADSQDNYAPDGEPDGAYINVQPDYGNLDPCGYTRDCYAVTLYGEYVGSPFATYDDALAALAGAIAGLGPAYADTPVWLVAHRTGLRVPFGMPIADVGVDWDRPANAADVDAFADADAGNAIGIEAVCLLCGGTFNPHAADEVTHGQREDETPCGGPGVIVGYWR